MARFRLKYVRSLIFAILALPAVSLADVTGRVVAVTDGDTIKVLDDTNTEHKIRLTGIDAPERGQPFGTASTKHLASMVAGKQVFVESEKKDRYGRDLGKVWVQPADCPTCGKTLDANYAQVLAGMAWWPRSSPRKIEGGMSLLRMKPGKENGVYGLIQTRSIRMTGERVTDNCFSL